MTENTLFVSPVNHVYLRVNAEPGILMELSERFTFDVPGAEWTPAYKRRHWDGKIRMFNMRNHTIYRGLLPRIVKWAEAQGYAVDTTELPRHAEPDWRGVSEEIKALKLTNYQRDYQLKILIRGIKEQRQTFVSPTGSGKSMAIYMLTRYYDKKTLIIVPTKALVTQMVGDFISYGWKDALKHCHQVMGGINPETHKQVVVSTWQSLVKLPREYFEHFDVVFGDECHQAQAKSLQSILEKMGNTRYRFGFTGTLTEMHAHRWTVEGLFGPVYQPTSTRELMERKVLAKLHIQVHALEYNALDRLVLSKLKYQQEYEYLVTHHDRRAFVNDLVLKQPGNVLVLFYLIEKQGEPLFEMLKKSTSRPVFLITGASSVEEREEVRRIFATHTDAIAVASYGTFSTGTNIPQLDHVVFSSPSKSRYRVLQSIGRALRVTKTKTTATVHDITDIAPYQGRQNYVMRHFKERIKLYQQEGFSYSLSVHVLPDAK